MLYWNWSSALLAHGWVGQNPFFLGPLYPYLLTALRSLEFSQHGILLLQSVWGALTVVLLADVARRLTSARTGLVVGLLLAGNQMMVFLDGQILMESLVLFLEALSLWVLSRLNWTRPQWQLALAWGILIGLQAQARVLAVAFILPFGIVLWRATRERSVVVGHLSLASACVALLAIPTTVRHAALTGELIPFTYSAGFNYYIGNHAEATGSFTPIRNLIEVGSLPGEPTDGGAEVDGRSFFRRTEGVDLGYTASSRRWMSRAVEFAVCHPAAEAGLLVKKALMMLNRTEYAQVSSLDVNRRAVGPIGWPALGTFAFLAILAAGGAAFVGRSWMGQYGLGAAIALVLGFASIFVTDRYRVHLVPPLVVLAAYGLEAWLVSARAKRVSRQLVLSSTTAVAILWLPMPSYSSARLLWNYHTELGRAWLEHDDPSQSAISLRQAIAIDEAGGLEGGASAAGRESRGAVYAMYGGSLGLLGASAEAIRALTRADSLQPNVVLIETELGAVLAQAGDEAKAASLFRGAGLSDREAADLLLERARMHELAGRGQFMRPLLRAAAHLAGDAEIAWVAFIRAEIQEGQWSAADTALAEAASHGIRPDVIIAHRALLAARSGHQVEADRLRQMLPKSATADPTLRDVIAAARGRPSDQVP